MPSEILICPPMLDFKDVTTYIKQHTNALVELREDACFKDAVMEQTMADQFGADWRTSSAMRRTRLSRMLWRRFSTTCTRPKSTA